jgi:hypothetical protein
MLSTPIQFINVFNCCASRYPALQNQQLDLAENANRDFQPGEWRQHCAMLDTAAIAGPNSASTDGKMQRNTLKYWCNSPAGSVDWQESMI